MADKHPLQDAIDYLRPAVGTIVDGDALYRKLLADALDTIKRSDLAAERRKWPTYERGEVNP